MGWHVQGNWRNNACTFKTSFLRIRFWFILIFLKIFFSKLWVTKLRVRLICECGLYTGVYGSLALGFCKTQHCTILSCSCFFFHTLCYIALQLISINALPLYVTDCKTWRFSNSLICFCRSWGFRLITNGSHKVKTGGAYVLLGNHA